MKSRLAIFLCMVLAASLTFAGEKQELKTQKDKFSYALGMDLGSNLKKNEIDVDPDIFLKAMKDGLSGNKPLLAEEEAKTILQAAQKDMQAKKQEQRKALGEKNKKEGEAFLAKNKTKEGVKTLPSGLQYKVIAEGKGKSPSASNDTVTVQYSGTLIDGTEFDSSYKRGQPATFKLNGVIRGWSEALQLMKEGSKWQLFIPSDLAYGAGGTQGLIGPNAVLIFEVELVSIKAQEKK